MRYPKLTLVILLIGFSLNTGISQKLVSADYIGSFSKDQLILDFNTVIIQYGVDMYRVLYETDDVHGALDTASGLMIIPDVLENTYPMLIYQHGTVGSRTDVPSNLNGGYQLALLYAAMGYVTTTADYLGLGVSRGIHPYIHAESEAWVAIDMHFAAKDFVEQNGLFVNDQLFITGYSQGGQAAMAAHRAVERDYAGELTVTAAAPMSGPYSLSEKMFEFTLGDDEYGFVGYIVSVALSFQLVYGDIIENDDLSNFFKPQYIPLIEQYKAEQIDLFDLNSQMIDLLIADVGGSIPKFLLLDEVREAVLSDPNHPINVALRDNDTYDWTPIAPTRIYYCTEDEQVFYENATFTEMVMKANGAENVISKNSGAFDHSGCVFPSVIDAIFWFATLQDITSNVDDLIGERPGISIYPNPATDVINIDFPQEGSWHIAVYNALGKKVFVDSRSSTRGFSFHLDESPGYYILRATNGQHIETAQIILN